MKQDMITAHWIAEFRKLFRRPRFWTGQFRT